MQVDREQVRMLVASVGYTEAAKQTGIKRDTLYKWGQRKGWKVPINHEQSASVQSVQSPGDALASTLADHSKRTKLGFSKAALKVAEAQAELPPERLRMPKEALAGKQWHSVAESVHGWNSEAGKDGGILGGLQVFSNQTVIQVRERSSNSAEAV